MEMKKQTPRAGGRKPKPDPAVHRYGIKLTGDENFRFRQMFEESGLDCYAKYIKSVLFNRTIRVVRVDKATLDYCVRLTQFYRQFQAVGNNYNQIVRALKSNFGQKRALQMLYRLEQRTIEMVVISKEVIRLTQEYEARYLRK